MAARSANTFDQDQLTAGRGLFLFQHPVLPPFSALDPHLPLPLKAPAFPNGNADTRHADYRRYIRKHIDPERAANFLKSMQQNGPQSATLLALAEQDVNDVIKADVTDKKRHLDVINDFFK